MTFIAKFALIAVFLMVSYSITQQASDASAWFVYLVLGWALLPYLYLMVQLRNAQTQDDRISRSVMALVMWATGVYFCWQSLRSDTPSDDQLLWLFGPLLQWLLMAVVAMLVAIVLLRLKRRAKT